MKKISLVLSLSLIAIMSFGQAKFEFGLKGGLNSATADVTDPATTVSSASSFHAGVYSLFKLGKLGIQPEILYSPQKNDVDMGAGELEQKKVYLDIPIMLKLYLVGGLNIQAGPQIGLLTSAEQAGEDIKEAFKGSDFSASFGAGWDAPFGLQVNARYIMGLSDITDSQTLLGEFKNRTLQLSVGYKLFGKGN